MGPLDRAMGFADLVAKLERDTNIKIGEEVRTGPNQGPGPLPGERQDDDWVGLCLCLCCVCRCCDDWEDGLAPRCMMATQTDCMWDM